MPQNIKFGNQKPLSERIEVTDFKTIIINAVRHIELVEMCRFHAFTPELALSFVTSLREFRAQDGQADTVKIINNRLYLTDTAYYALATLHDALFSEVKMQIVLAALGHYDYEEPVWRVA